VGSWVVPGEEGVGGRSPAAVGTGRGAEVDASDAVIEVSGLRMAYDGFEAVRGVDLRVRHGEIFTFLGPNGAGKTTTVEILEGHRNRTAGEVRVLGVDPQHADRRWRARVGVVLQTSRVEQDLTVRECLELYAGYYPAPRSVPEVIKLVGLEKKAEVRGGLLSGGQQRRMDVALALIGDPELVFLDEPTTGFDPSARRAAWEMIDGLRELGKTIFLTTHYMDEAEALADRIAVLSVGRIVAEGTPSTLGGRDRAAYEITFTPPEGVAIDELPVPSASVRRLDESSKVLIESKHIMATLHELSGWAIEHGHEVSDLQVHRPALEDVYLALTEQHT
jgi:ABC-2 type transport system ATP-binding protein